MPPKHAMGIVYPVLSRCFLASSTAFFTQHALPSVANIYQCSCQGENPFEVTDQTPEQQAEEDKADEPVEEEEEEAEAEEEEEAETAEQTDFTLDQTEDA